MRDREPARTLTARTAPASTPEAGVLLQLALDGSDIDCVAATGWSPSAGGEDRSNRV